MHIPSEPAERLADLDGGASKLSTPALSLNDANSGASRFISAQTLATGVPEEVDRSSTARTRNSWNESAPIMQLPLELLVAVFELLPTLDALSACCVCVYWNKILAHGAPSAWATLSSRGLRNGALTALLPRSGSLPCHLDLVITTRNWKEVSVCLTDTLARCVSLKVLFCGALRVKAKRELAEALTRPAPLLRLFEMFDADDQYYPVIVAPASLFDGTAPALREVGLLLDLRTLWHVRLPAVRRVAAASTRVGRVTDLEALMHAFPNAHELALHMDEWDMDYRQGFRVPVSASVQRLSIVLREPDFDPGLLLRCLDHRAVPHITVDYTMPPNAGASAMLDELASFSRVTTMNFSATAGDEADGRRPICIDMWAGAPRAPPQRTVMCYPCDAPISAALFAQLTRLDVGEFALADCAALPSAPVLEELTIRAGAPEFQADEGHKSVFLLPRDRATVLVCPALRKLTFGARRHDEGVLRLAPHLALDFIRFHLDAPPLEMLSIKGMELDTNVLDDVVELISIARDFVVESDYLVVYE